MFENQFLKSIRIWFQLGAYSSVILLNSYLLINNITERKELDIGTDYEFLKDYYLENSQEKIATILSKDQPLDLPLIPEHQLNRNNYLTVNNKTIGLVTFTSGYMEGQGHSNKPELKAIFLDGELKILPPAPRNIGIDYYVADGRVNAWYSGRVISAQREGGYGRRITIKLNRTMKLNNQNYNVYQSYGHNKAMLVETGQEVLQGQQIAVQGGSGFGEQDYPPHVDLSTYIYLDGSKVEINPQLLD